MPKINYFVYYVKGAVIFRRSEVSMLMEFSTGHYDSICRKLSYVGGFLYGIHSNFIRHDMDESRGEHTESLKETTEMLEMAQVDLLCKVMELAKTTEEVALLTGLRHIFKQMNAENIRLNENRSLLS